MESKACATPHRSVAELKADVEEQWATMSEEYLKNTCKAFRTRIELMVEADGGNFEK